MKKQNKIETNAKSSFLNFVTATKERKSLKSLFGIHQGVQVIPRLHLFRFIVLSLLGLLTSHFVGTSLIHSAYAASYVNVSSGGGNSGTSSSETVSPGIVNLGSIKPSSSGTMATGNDTLTIHTDCSAGYKVYVSGQNGKSTNLINSNAEDPTSPEVTELISSASNLPNSTSATSSPSSAAVLNSNTWGINGNATDISSHLYYGLPSYSDATAYPLVTKSNVPEESTVPIYYGVKVNTDITPGTYTGDVLYTVIMDTSCTSYNVSFNPNVTNASDVSGTMETQPILINTTDNLTKNNFIRSGYGFLGWSTSANGKTGTVTNGIGTPNDVEYSDESEVTDLVNVGQTITLYAIWAKVDGNMQSWNGCSTLTTNQIVYLTDTRDNKTYGIKKTPDGKCWILQNLTISGTGLIVDALNNTNTNIPNTDNTSYYLPPRNTRYAVSESINNPNVLTATDIVAFDAGAASNQPQIGYRNVGSTDNDTSTPVPEESAYYSYYTASLGYTYYGDDKASGSTPRDVCPKGWHLPWATDDNDYAGTTSEYRYLADHYSPSAVWTPITSSSYVYSKDETLLSIISPFVENPLNPFSNNESVGFSASGYFRGSNVLKLVGDTAWYPSSSIAGTSYAYTFTVSTSNTLNNYPWYKTSGYPIRCIVDNYTISFDANGGTGTMESQVVFGNNTTTQTIKTNTFTRTGYHFLGWSTDSSATSATYADGQTLTAPLAENGRTIKLYAIWAPNTFTINYNSNGGSGTTNPTTATYDTNATLATNSFTAPSGKKFKSWGTSSSGGTTYSSGQSGIAPTTLKPDITTTNGGSITLYAIWESDIIDDGNKGNMQTSNICSSVGLGHTATLKDTRDNQTYSVYRWPNTGTAGTNYPTSMAGYCIMTKDLSLGYVTGGSVTKGANLTLTTSNSAAAGTITARTSKSDWSTTDANTNTQYVNGPQSGKETYSSHSYYSYGAAQKVCPKGWRLPTKAEYDNIATFMGGDNSRGSSKIRSAPYNFVYGGIFRSSDWGYVGSLSYHWSSTQHSSPYGYLMSSGSVGLNTLDHAKNYGMSVRCISS